MHRELTWWEVLVEVTVGRKVKDKDNTTCITVYIGTYGGTRLKSIVGYSVPCVRLGALYNGTSDPAEVPTRLLCLRTHSREGYMRLGSASSKKS